MKKSASEFTDFSVFADVSSPGPRFLDIRLRSQTIDLFELHNLRIFILKYADWCDDCPGGDNQQMVLTNIANKVHEIGTTHSWVGCSPQGNP